MSYRRRFSNHHRETMRRSPEPPKFAIVQGPVPQQVRSEGLRVIGWGWNDREQTETSMIYRWRNGLYLLTATHMGWSVRPIVLLD